MKNVIEKIAYDMDLTKKAAKDVVDLVVDKLVEEFVSEGKLKIAQLGTLVIAERAARTGRNPKTGDAVEIPAKRVIKFKAVKQLTEKIQ